MNAITKVKNFKNKLAVKVVSSAVAVCTAVSCMAMSAFATEGSSGGSSDAVDTVVTSMQTELTGLVSKAGVAIAAIVGVGLTIFAVKWIVGVLKSFFSKLAK